MYRNERVSRSVYNSSLSRNRLFMRHDGRREYAVRLQDISEALIADGYTSLDAQAKALGVHRSTAWTIMKAKHKLGRLSLKTTNSMLAILKRRRLCAPLSRNISTNCEHRRDLGALQLAEATSSYSTSAVSCCAHSEQLNMSRSQPGVPVREMSYSRIARPQLGHAVLPIGCSDLNKLNWGIAPLLALPKFAARELVP